MTIFEGKESLQIPESDVASCVFGKLPNGGWVIFDPKNFFAFFSFSWRKDYNTKQNSYSLQIFFNQLFEIGIPGNGLERDFLLLLSQPDQIEEVKEARLLAASTTPGIGQPL